MILSQIEINAYKRGFEEGKKLGFKLNFEEGRKEGIQKAIQMRADVLQKQNSDLTDEEAIRIAKKDLGF